MPTALTSTPSTRRWGRCVGVDPVALDARAILTVVVSVVADPRAIRTAVRRVREALMVARATAASARRTAGRGCATRAPA